MGPLGLRLVLFGLFVYLIDLRFYYNGLAFKDLAFALDRPAFLLKWLGI